MKSYYELYAYLGDVAGALDDGDLRQAVRAFGEMLDFVSAAHRDPSPGGQHVGMNVHYRVYAPIGLVERVTRMTDAAMKLAASPGTVKEGGEG